MCPEPRLCPLEGKSGLGDRGNPRGLQMGEENPERVRGPEVGMSMTMKDLKDPYSWAKRF